MAELKKISNRLITTNYHTIHGDFTITLPEGATNEDFKNALKREILKKQQKKDLVKAKRKQRIQKIKEFFRRKPRL